MARTTTPPGAVTAVPSTLGGRLRYHRERAGLTREQVASSSFDRGFRTLEKWERGESTPGLDGLRQLAALYRVPVIDLLGEDDHCRATSVA